MLLLLLSMQPTALAASRLASNICQIMSSFNSISSGLNAIMLMSARSGLQASEAYLQTNNQVLSLTDQMNLGVRIVELDTHFFDVRIPKLCVPVVSWPSQPRHELRQDMDVVAVVTYQGCIKSAQVGIHIERPLICMYLKSFLLQCLAVCLPLLLFSMP